MKVRLLLVFHCLITTYCLAQEHGDRAIPQVTEVSVSQDSVSVLHLSAGYTTAVRVPEDVNSVVVGNPAQFRAEHSESEPRLVFLKPITGQAAKSNALITTKSGQEINLHLVSEGQSTAQPTVDFFVDYRRPRSAIIEAENQGTFLVPETKPLATQLNVVHSANDADADLAERALAGQKALSSPAWEGKQLQAALGESIEYAGRMIVPFSVRNDSKSAIEVMPPQIELSGSKGRKQIKADPIAISDYRLVPRRLEAGARSDGVVIFDRPSFKESHEQLLLRLADASQVDRPIVLLLPFTGKAQGGTR
jgi:hypothetical protein